MAFERLYKEIGPVLFTADGLNNGIITITTTDCFKVKMFVVIESDTITHSRFQIKRVLSETQMIIGPENKSINAHSDMSLYTLLDNPRITAPDQPRPDISNIDYERAVYEEEPTVAKRVFNVDKYGNPYTDTNPFPITDTAPDFEPTHFEDSIALAGTPTNIAISGKDIQLAFIFNPNKGPSKNGSQDVLFITIDGSTKKTTIPRGASRYFPGIFSTLEIDTNNNGTNYEVIVWSEE